MLPRELPAVPVYRGDTTLMHDLTWMDDVTTPTNLLLYTWRAQWRLKPNDPNPLELELDMSDAEDGRIVITAPAEVTAAMTGSGVCDLESTRNGVVRTWARWKTSLIQDVTR